MPVLTFDELNILVAAAFVFGVVLGSIYSLFKVVVFFFVTKDNNHKLRVIVYHIIQFFVDLSFWLICAASAVVLFSSYGKGQVRIIALIVMALGFVLWRQTMGKFTYKFSVFLKKVIYITAKFIYIHTVRHLFILVSRIFMCWKEKNRSKELKKYHLKQTDRVSLFVKGEGE